ncbi:MAG: DUF5716 family protein [Bacilli bacterium]|nr:DUF5716 family protein [Bacilli bacterium]
MKLFDRIPTNFFSLLSRKYRSVYAFALLTLYDALKTYKIRIKRSDYVMMLKNRGSELLNLFDINEDKSEDGDNVKDETPNIDDNLLNQKVNYIIRKLAQTGWIEIEKEQKTNTFYIYLPSYTVYSLELIKNICSDTSSYVPLVHQTYSELKLEDEKEDDFMFRTLLNTLKNAESLELNVSMLHHSICVYNHRLTNILSPNDILSEHFNDYASEVSDNIYHPMKTYDSFGLYALPIVNILKKWLYSERVLYKLADQARLEPEYVELSVEERIKRITKILNRVIDIFNELHDDFSDIDNENSNYIESVQKKVRYLSNNDRTVKGKVEVILLTMARELYENDGDVDKCPTIAKGAETIQMQRSGLISESSLTMPIRRGTYEETELMGLEDPVSPEENALNAYLDKEVNEFGQAAVNKFMLESFGNNKEIDTETIDIKNMEQLTLLILGIINSQFDDSIINKERFENINVRNGSFELPKYKLTRKDK